MDDIKALLIIFLNTVEWVQLSGGTDRAKNLITFHVCEVRI